MEVAHSVGIGDNLNRVASANISIDIRTRGNSPSVLYYVSEVISLGDCIDPDTLLSFTGLSISYNAVKPHAINLPFDYAAGRVNE